MRLLLPANVELDKMHYPVVASYKIDGVRAAMVDGVLTSRSGKPLPNQHTQRVLGNISFNGVDGELIVGDPTARDAFRTTTSGVMSVAGRPNIHWYVFDLINIFDGGVRRSRVKFVDRYKRLKDLIRQANHNDNCIHLVEQVMVSSEKALLEFEKKALDLGYEGVMLRDPNSLYKHGRSTLRQACLLRLKRFVDSEAVVLEVVEQRHNDNEARKDELGYTVRSTKKAGMRPTGVLGGLVVRDVKTKQEFSIGTGFTADERANLWPNRDDIVGRVVKYKYFPTGSKDLPRFPTFLGFRSQDDM